MKVVSLFAGAGGLDLGFKLSGFDVIWANEYDKSIWKTFESNFPDTFLDKRSITEIPSNEIPDCDGIVGGPPCQSWSEAGSLRGIEDNRGKLFFEYIRIIKDKKPKFFLAENVSGILAERHKPAFSKILRDFKKLGYEVTVNLLNTNDYNVPQDRERVIIVGYRKDFKKSFQPPKACESHPVLLDAIKDLEFNVVPALESNRSNSGQVVDNHEYMTGGFSSIFMSRNRVRPWNKPSFTIQAGARHAPLHPQAPEMILVSPNVRIFSPGHESLYRRLSVRECARIQTFPDSFKFIYSNVTDGYKMIGNAVPVEFARRLALQILTDIK